MKISTPAGAIGEIKGLRTSHAKVFDMGGGKHMVRQGIRPVHNRTNLEEIDESISLRQGKFRSANTDYDLQVNRQDYSFTFTTDAGYATIQITHIDDQPIGMLPINLSPVTQNGELWLIDVLPGLDLFFKGSEDRVALQKLIKTDTAPRKFTMKITTDKGVTIEHRALGRDNYNNLADPDRITVKDAQRQIISTEETTPETDLGNGSVEYDLTQEWLGTVARVDPVTRVKSISPDVLYPVRMHVLVQETIAADGDDGEEVDATTWSARSGSQLFRVGRNSANTFHGGLRFTSIAIPQGATIDDATLGLEVTATHSPTGFSVAAEDADTGAAISGTNRPSQWTLTTASASLDTALNTTGSRTVDVATVIQEIVNRAGWASGNNINLGLMNDGAPATAYDYASIVDVSTWGNANWATLDINYTVGGGSEINIASTATVTMTGDSSVTTEASLVSAGQVDWVGEDASSGTTDAESDIASTATVTMEGASTVETDSQITAFANFVPHTQGTVVDFEGEATASADISIDSTALITMIGESSSEAEISIPATGEVAMTSDVVVEEEVEEGVTVEPGGGGGWPSKEHYRKKRRKKIEQEEEVMELIALAMPAIIQHIQRASVTENTLH